jgi:hypothetical protein
MPCTTEYSTPRYSIAIAFVCAFVDMAARPGLGTAPRPLRAWGRDGGRAGARNDAQPANKTIRWIELFLAPTALPTTSKASWDLLGGVIPRPCAQAMALHQASPVRRLIISKPLPFVCTAGVSARRGHLLRGRRSSPRLPVYLGLLHGFLDAAVSQGLSKDADVSSPREDKAAA